MKNTRKVKSAKDALAYDILEKADINSRSDLNTLVQELTKKFIEKSLDAELENHLGYKNEIRNLVKCLIIIVMVIQRKKLKIQLEK